MFVDSIIIAHNVPIIPPIINEINKYFGLEHKFDVLQIISDIINIGNMIKVAMFCVCKLLIAMKYVKYANV